MRPNELAETVLAAFRRAVEGLAPALRPVPTRLARTMRDLFDDFLEELRRREAAARGEEPDPSPKPPTRRDPDDRDPDDDDPTTASPTTTTRRRATRTDAEPPADGPATGSDDRSRRGPRAARRRRRDAAAAGASASWAHRSRRRRALRAVHLRDRPLDRRAVVSRASASIGVFWTRVGAQALLFVGGWCSPSWSCSATSGSPAG